MAKSVNSFALLDDDVEDDDVEALFNRIVNKAVDSTIHAHNEDETSDFARNGSGSRKGKGHWDGSHDNGNGWDDDIKGGGGLEWNHSRDSYGSGHGKDFGGENGWGDNVNEAFGGENGWGNVNEVSGGENGWGNVNEASGSGSGDCNIQTVNDDAGWQEVSKSRKDYAYNGCAFGDKHGYKNGNDVEKRGYWDQVQDNGAADGQRQYRNGNQRYGGERRGYVNQGQGNNADGRRYRNGRRGCDGERRGHDDKVQDNNAKSEQHSMEVDVSEDNRAGGEERKHRSGNRNYGGEKRGYGGNRERGRPDYRNDDGHDFRAVHVNDSGGDAEMVWEASKAAEIEEHNITEEVSEDTRVPKEDTEEQKKKTELELKKKEEEMKEAALMTLDEYEKLLLEKKQALNLQKTELRKVTIDKELEGMQLIEKKPLAIDEIWKPAKDKQKMKNSPKNQASETSKTEDNGEVTESDVNLISEEEKLQKDGSLEKKEKSRKFVAVEVHEIFKSTFHRRSSGGRGQGRGGRGEQGGFSDRTNSDAAGRAPARAPASRRPRIPTDKDFPVLGVSLSAPVKKST